MPKAPRHRKRVRTARVAAQGAPLGQSQEDQVAALGEDSTLSISSQAGHDGAQGGKGKKVGKKEAEVTNLLDKLRSDKVEDRTWASSALANLMPTLPQPTQRLLLSNNLIGLLIERLNDPDPTVAVECLGALRNLAVSSPPSIVSEMHNKRLLLPLTTTHFTALGPLVLQARGAAPVPAPKQPTLPASAEQRRAVEEDNARDEAKRKLVWDWSENVLTLLWCLAESTTKILTSLNAHADKIIQLTMMFLDAEALGLQQPAVQSGGMDVDGDKKGGKKKNKKDQRDHARVPLFVAVAAAQTLHAFISANPSAHTILLSHPSLPSLAVLLESIAPPTTRTARTESHAASTPESDAEDFAQLRVLAFGIMLELTKSGFNGRGRKEMREVLKSNQGVLVNLIGTDLNGVASASRDVVQQMDPKLTEAPGAGSSGHGMKLASYERQLSTLQLSLEVLGEWCAIVDAESLGGEAINGEAKAADDEEEWGGIQLDEDGDAGMDEDDDVDELPDDSIITKPRPEDMQDDEDEDDAPPVELSSSTISLFSQLPGQLLKLAHPTDLSFLPAPSDSASNKAAAAAPSTLLTPAAAPTTTPSPAPTALAGIAEILTTIHVRALECLNNLYITLARASSSQAVAAHLATRTGLEDLQRAWETTLGLVQAAAGASTSQNQGSGASPAVKEDEMDELEQRRMEIVGAGTGAAWGMARIGLEAGRATPGLSVGPSAAQFLIELFSHAFARVPSPAGEAIRVRIAGALGWIGRRQGISIEENEAIGTLLILLLPIDAKTPSPFQPTPEVLIQAVDSVIDVYADEDASYDVAVFRQKGFLAKLVKAVPGVRAAVKKIDRKKYPELRGRADGALENLVAFVDYRRQFE